jgi:hypothetical protein
LLQGVDSEYLKTLSTEKDIETKIYQIPVWHKKFADLLNVVVMVKTNLKRVRLFCNDVLIFLILDSDTLKEETLCIAG